MQVDFTPVQVLHGDVQATHAEAKATKPSGQELKQELWYKLKPVAQDLQVYREVQV